MQKGKKYKEMDAYVNDICAAFISPNSEIESIECRHKLSEGLSFIRVIDCTNNSDYFDVSDYTLEQICHLVSQIILGADMKELIQTHDARKEVAALFKQ